MHQKKKKRMWLRQMESEEKKGNNWILSMAVTFLSSELLLLVMGEFFRFYQIYTPWIVAISAGCVCILYGIMMKIKKILFFFPEMLCLLFLFLLFCKRWIVDGFCIFWNQMRDLWLEGSGCVLPKLEHAFEISTQNISLFLFSIFTGCSIALLCCAIAFLEKRILAILLPASIFAGMILFHKNYISIYTITALVLSICLLVCDEEHQKKKWLLIVGCSAVFLMGAFIPVIRNWAIQTGNDVQTKIHEFRYETDYTTLPEGNFSEYTKEKNIKQTALVVSMEKPEELYLRGFTGAVFQENRWNPLDTKILAENEELLYWMNQNGWSPHTLYEQAACVGAENEKQTITVQNVNACNRYLYVPYNLCFGEYLNVKNISTDGVDATGARTYVYEICSGGTKKISELLEHIQKEEKNPIEKNRKAQLAYKEFVYHNYLQIPQEVTKQLLPYWEEVRASYGKSEALTSQEKQDCVLTFLKEYVEDNKENIMLPLAVAQESSYQYATVATLTLRYFGIPARYVEGYVITEEMAQEMDEGNSIKVDADCQGAWTEVYQDGIGWIPMDVTPGIEKQSQNMDGEDGNSPKKKPSKGKEVEESEKLEEPLEESEPQGGYVVAVKKMISWTALWALGMVLLLLIFLIVRRNILLKRRQKRWEVEDVKDAVGWIFADTLMILEKLGFSRGNGSVWDLKSSIQQRFGDDYANAFDGMAAINARAMFSSHVLEQEYREHARAFYNRTLKYVKDGTKWHEKVWMQWVLCLY